MKTRQTKLEKIKSKILNNKDLIKRINAKKYYSIDDFINDSERYIKAIKERRMFCVIDSVSSSGMSRNIHFHEFRIKNKKGFTLQFYTFFCAMGFAPVGKYKDSFRISGCGMNMIFHTNYTNIHRLYNLGFISKKECSKLAQETPSIY